MLNSHCNNKDKKIFKKKKPLWSAGREPTIHELKDHRVTRYATEFGAKKR